MTTVTSPGYADLPGLMAQMTGDEKHAGASASTMDILWVLYNEVLDVAPDRVDDPARDRFLLSKGHGPSSYYAVLAAKGFLEPETLSSWGTAGSLLGFHPDHRLVPGVEIGAGSLGHGLPIGVGVALGLRTQHLAARVVVLIGDGELDEGSNHEAISAAARFGLDRLTVIVVDNGTASLGWPGGIARRFVVEGWSAHTVDAHDHEALRAALTRPAEPGAPTVVVAQSPYKDKEP
jgi:transketolase